MPLPVLAFGGLGRSDQGGINDRALFHGQTSLIEVAFHSLEDLLSEFVLLKQVAEGQDRNLIGDSVANQVDPSETAHGGHLNQRPFHAESLRLYHYCIR